jgi:hypothetical protein
MKLSNWPVVDENGKLDLRGALRDPKTGHIYATRSYIRESREGEVPYYRFLDGEYAGQVYTEDGKRHPEREESQEVKNVETERTATSDRVSGNRKESGTRSTNQPTA